MFRNATMETYVFACTCSNVQRPNKLLCVETQMHTSVTRQQFMTKPMLDHINEAIIDISTMAMAKQEHATSRYA